MSMGLTNRQKATLTFVADYMAAHEGVSPSYDEIRNGLGLRSKSGVHRLITALAQRGHITRRRDRARSVAIGPDYRALLQTLAELVNGPDTMISAIQMSRQVLDHFREAAQ